jgi:prophage antirepressor-like protein
MTSTKQQSQLSATALALRFEGHPVIMVSWHGRPCWIVANVGQAMGYADGVLQNQIRREWSDEFVCSVDFDIIEGPELRELRAALNVCYTFSANTRALTVLYEGGMHLVCIKTDKPAGKRLRRWLATEVLPQVVRTGEFSMAPRDTEISSSVLDLFAAMHKTIDAQRAEIQALAGLPIEVALIKASLARNERPFGMLGRSEAAKILTAIRSIASLENDKRTHLREYLSAIKKINDDVREWASLPNRGRWDRLDASCMQKVWMRIGRLEGEAQKRIGEIAARRAAEERARQGTLFPKPS